jgi:chemotaxis protein methyltransferase CheR
MSRAQSAYSDVLEFLGSRTGLSFPQERRDCAEQGVRRAMQRAGILDLDRYRMLVRNDDSALDDLIGELTVGETYFFREPAQFEFIRDVVLPDIVRRRGTEHRIRAWSAACASGEEAYSLAMLFAEAELAGGAHLLATDISRTALAKATDAAYQDWSLRGDGARAATRHLQRKGKRFVVEDAIRRTVTFDYLNLALDVYPSFATFTWGMDLILCRNVLIYFDQTTIRNVTRRLFDALAPGGWLITASSDPPPNQGAPFEVVVTDNGIFHRKPLDCRQPATLSWSRQVAGDDHNASDQYVSEPAEAVQSVSHNAPDVDRPPSPIDDAHDAFARGDYDRAAELTVELGANADSCALHVRALANIDTTRSECACAEAAAHHPLSAEIQYLHAALLLELGHIKEAILAARRVVYLDRSLAAGHFALATAMWRHGDRTGARRAYRNARDLCAMRPAEEEVPLADGERAGRLAEAAAAHLAILETTPEVMP